MTPARTIPSIPEIPGGIVTCLVAMGNSSSISTVTPLLSSLGHLVIHATDGEAARAEATQRKIALILLDQELAGADWTEQLKGLLSQEPQAAVILIGPTDSAAAAITALRHGAADYLPQPLDPDTLRAAISQVLQQRQVRLEEHATHQWLQREFIWRGAALEREHDTLQQISVAVLEALVNALEAKDPYLRGHSARIADLSALIASELRCSDQEIEVIRTAGRLHDIGKIGVRESIFNKQGPLTDEEYQHVKEHVTIGAEILAPLPNLGEIIRMVRHHHERYDGTGYPDGLTGNQIPLGARILGVAEVYDALTTSRPYQEKMTPEQAADRMRDLVTTVLDPEVHRALTAAISRRKALVFLDEESKPL